MLSPKVTRAMLSAGRSFLGPATTLRDIFSDWRVLLASSAAVLFLPAPLLRGYLQISSGVSFTALASPPYALLNLLSFILIPSIVVATMTVSGAPRWPWLEWVRRIVLSTLYAVIYVGVFTLGTYGTVFPILAWSTAYHHNPVTAILHAVIGVPLGLLLWAYGGVTWVEIAARKRGAFSGAIARVSAHPLRWILLSAALFGATLLLNWGVTALENWLQAAFVMEPVASFFFSALGCIPLVFYGIGWVALAAHDEANQTERVSARQGMVR